MVRPYDPVVFRLEVEGELMILVCQGRCMSYFCGSFLEDWLRTAK